MLNIVIHVLITLKSKYMASQVENFPHNHQFNDYKHKELKHNYTRDVIMFRCQLKHNVFVWMLMLPNIMSK
jgi:hypothetical protein